MCTLAAWGGGDERITERRHKGSQPRRVLVTARCLYAVALNLERGRRSLFLRENSTLTEQRSGGGWRRSSNCDIELGERSLSTQLREIEVGRLLHASRFLRVELEAVGNEKRRPGGELCLQSSQSTTQYSNPHIHLQHRNSP